MALKKEYENFLPLETILEAIDLDSVAKCIVTDEAGKEVKMAEFDFEDSKRLIINAAEKWLPRDIFEFECQTIEEKMYMEIPRQIAPFRGLLDFAGTMRGRIEPFKQYKSQRFIVDWKTSKNTLGTEWKQKLLDSWQWMYYSVMYDAQVFIYRGLSRNGETKEVIIKVDDEKTPGKTREEVIQHLTAVGDQLNVLRDGNFDVYPRNMPFACGAYGRDCPYISDCRNYSMPRKPLLVEKGLSYSFIQDFMLCNEKARRNYTLEIDNLGSEETEFGKATHRGLAELWRQAYKIYGT